MKDDDAMFDDLKEQLLRTVYVLEEAEDLQAVVQSEALRWQGIVGADRRKGAAKIRIASAIGRFRFAKTTSMLGGVLSSLQRAAAASLQMARLNALSLWLADPKTAEGWQMWTVTYRGSAVNEEGEGGDKMDFPASTFAIAIAIVVIVGAFVLAQSRPRRTKDADTVPPPLPQGDDRLPVSEEARAGDFSLPPPPPANEQLGHILVLVLQARHARWIEQAFGRNWELTYSEEAWGNAFLYWSGSRSDYAREIQDVFTRDGVSPSDEAQTDVIFIGCKLERSMPVSAPPAQWRRAASAALRAGGAWQSRRLPNVSFEALHNLIRK